MTLQTPQLLPINAFDPSYEHIIKFIYDDVQAVRNRLVITDNDTSDVVYDVIQDSMRLQHTILSGSLQSGKSYIAQIQIFDINNNQSNLSDSVLFYCFSSPQFYFNNVKNEDLIYKTSIDLSVTYLQDEGELLKDIQFYLYNSDGSIRSYSNLIYSNQNTYTFYDLKNDSAYYVQAIGHTVNGMNLDTGKVLFNVKYITIPANIVFEVENNAKNGYITLFSGIIDIGYDIDNDNYLIGNGAVAIWGDNRVTYNKGFLLDGDFILHLESKYLPLYYPFLRLNDDIELSIIKIGNDYYCKLSGVNSSQHVRLPNSRLTSDESLFITTDEGKVIEIISLDYQDSEYIIYEIKRVNGIYGLNAYYKSDIEKEG